MVEINVSLEESEAINARRRLGKSQRSLEKLGEELINENYKLKMRINELITELYEINMTKT